MSLLENLITKTTHKMSVALKMNARAKADYTAIAASKLFDSKFYLATYPDVAAAKINPLVHYVNYGWREKRRPSAIFDGAWYQATNVDVLNANVNPLVHFIQHGSKEGRNPNPLFDAKWYRRRNLSASAAEPLFHYINQGAAAGLDPSPSFNTKAYLAEHPELNGSQIIPLAHYLESVQPNFLEPIIVPGPLPLKKVDDATQLASLANLTKVVLGNDNALQATVGKIFQTKEHAAYALAKTEIPFSSGISGLGRLLTLFGIGGGVFPEHAPDDVDFKPTDFILDRYQQTRLEVGNRIRLDALKRGTATGPIKISVVMPTYNTPIAYLERSILSVICQTYDNWELCIADDGSTSENRKSFLNFYAELDPRIKVSFATKNGGISAATNRAVQLASGSYIGLLDSDDMLACDALEKVAARLENDNAVDLVYTDECKIDGNDIVSDLFCKPDWSPLLLLNYMYTAHFSVYRKSLIEQLGGFRSEFDLSQDYDLALRVAETNPKVAHVPEYLYGWRMIAGSAAQGDKPHARQTNIAALQSSIERRGWNATARPLSTANKVDWKLNDKPLISLIVPSDSTKNILDTISSITSRTEYDRYEIIIVTNTGVATELKALPALQRTDRVIFAPYDKPYNFSDKCNVGAALARGDYFVFINDDVRVISADWIDSLIEWLRLPNVGAVGPKLLYEDGSIQHAGMVTGVRRLVGTAIHSFPGNTGAHFNLAQCVREVSLLCGACLAIKKTVFNEVGGFDAKNVPISHSDVDLCFKIRKAGYSNVYTPYATLTHIGHLSIGKIEQDKKRAPHKQDLSDIHLLRKWSKYLANDPFFTKPMREILYHDSQETFVFHPSELRSDAVSDLNRNAIIFSHDLSESGAPKIAYNMARILLERGYYVLVVAGAAGEFLEKLNRIGADVIVDHLALAGHESTAGLAKNFDLCICNTVVTWRNIQVIDGATRSIIYIHENTQIEQLAAEHADFFDGLKRFDEILVGSWLTADTLAKHGIKAKVLEYGVELPKAFQAVDLLKPKAKTGKNIKIAVFGTIEPRKGQDLAINGFLAMPKSCRDRSSLRLVGRVYHVPFSEEIRQIAKESDRITIESPLDYESYQAAMMQTDIVLVCSRDDPLPLVSLDALALGKVLVCSQETGTSRYISNKKSGFILSRNDPAAIADTLEEIIANWNILESVAANAKAVFEKNFTASAFERKFSECLGLE